MIQNVCTAGYPTLLQPVKLMPQIFLYKVALKLFFWRGYNRFVRQLIPQSMEPQFFIKRHRFPYSPWLAQNRYLSKPGYRDECLKSSCFTPSS